MIEVRTKTREEIAKREADSPSTPLQKQDTAPQDIAAQAKSEKAGAFVMAARRAQRKGQNDEARTQLRSALAIDANDASGLELLGDLFMQEGEQENAIKIFERGKEYHPEHAAFQEKIALCLIDIEEMRRDRDRRQHILENGGVESWMLLSAPRAFSLSILLPGAGQAYVDQMERAAWMLGAAFVSFLGWTLPLYFGLKGARAEGVKAIDKGIGYALGHMSGPMVFWFWLCVAAWVGIYTYSAVDAMAQAEKINDLRKQGWDVE